MRAPLPDPPVIERVALAPTARDEGTVMVIAAWSFAQVGLTSKESVKRLDSPVASKNRLILIRSISPYRISRSVGLFRRQTRRVTLNIVAVLVVL